jgi:hypothetical protein
VVAHKIEITAEPRKEHVSRSSNYDQKTLNGRRQERILKDIRTRKKIEARDVL